MPDTSKPTYGQIINDLTIGKFHTLAKVQPTGSLQCRKQINGLVAFCWRYSIGTKSERVPIGNYDSSAAPKSLTPTARGFSVQAAIRVAEELAICHHSNRKNGGRPALLAAQAEAAAETVRLAEAARQTENDEMAAKSDAKAHTLRSLLNLYCDDQKRLGRTSHKDARSIFKLHIFEPWPEIAGLPANEVTDEQIADMMRRLHEAGHKRTANKLRSYAAAAYAKGKAARSDATVPIAFKLFKIKHNPAKETVPDVGANKADKDPLSVMELRRYWRGIRRMEGSKGGVLRLHLLTGAQRIEQLMNLKTADISAKSILIHDGKGRPGREPRPHSVPLIPVAAKSLTVCSPKGEFALSTDGGKTHLSASTFSEWAKESAAGIAGFKAKRIRSGVETLLSGAKIAKDDRGHLQSHGITGVQDRHYDGHDYMEEKRQALNVLYKLLEAPHVKK